MRETTKLKPLRVAKGYAKFFKGAGIDIGCGPDPLTRTSYFPDLLSVRPYDLCYNKDDNAQTCANIADNSFDFVYSSHCLEHMVDPHDAFRNWMRICRPGGYLIVALPHETYYEKDIWPSRFNLDHKWSFRTAKDSNLPKSIHVKEFLNKFDVEVILCEEYIKDFDMNQFYKDQTLGKAICQIEFVVKKEEV